MICALAIAACQRDAQTLLNQCLSGVYCGSDQTPDTECCQNMYESDVLNCYVLCGANQPDGDAMACCEDDNPFTNPGDDSTS